LILLSGPPSLLIVVQPGVEVNAVVDAAAAEADRGDAEPIEEREADAEVFRGLRPGEAADHRSWERGMVVVHGAEESGAILHSGGPQAIPQPTSYVVRRSQA